MAHATTLVSVGYNNLPANSDSPPSISADGRYVAFDSDSPNLVPGDTDGCGDVFVRDMVAHTTQRVSITTSGQQQQPNPYGDTEGYNRCGVGVPQISGDGSTVAFISSAWNLYGLATPPSTWMSSHLYVRNLAARTTTLVDSFDPAVLPGALAPRTVTIDGDGGKVFWGCLCASGAKDPTPVDLYVYDTATATNTQISDQGGTLADAPEYPSVYGGTISADGNYVVFDSTADNLAPEGDTNEVDDVFIQRVG